LQSGHRHRMPGFIALPLHCPHCGESVTLRVVEWGVHPPAHLSYTCLHCQRVNRLQIPGRIARVTKTLVI
jgi:hypothetical protein